VDDGAALFEACTKHGLEGVVSKLATAPYRSGRTKTWLKTKWLHRIHLCRCWYGSRPQNRST
jgi:ATP-dependent DNA ligase